MKQILATIFNIPVLLICTLFITTSCNKHEKYLYVEKKVPTTKYKIINTEKTSQNPRVYLEPRNNAICSTLKEKNEVNVLDTVYRGKVMWIKVEFYNPTKVTGYVRKNQIVSYSSYKYIQVKSPLSEALKTKGNPIAGSVAEFYEWTHSKCNLTNFVFLLLTLEVLLVWPLAIKIYKTEIAGHWWEYLIMLFAAALAIWIWLACDLFATKKTIDIGWFIELIISLFILALPLGYWLCTSALLSVSIENIVDESYNWVKSHIVITIVCFIIGTFSFWCWKSILDIIIICCAVIQGLFLLTLLVKTIAKKQIIPFILYAICFLMMALGGLILSSISFTAIISWIFIGILFASPFCAKPPQYEVVGYEIKTRTGQTIDTTDRWGHSSKTGRDYNV